MDNVAPFPQSTASPGVNSSPVPPDRITELYRGEIFTEESSRVARERVHWMCAQCRGDDVLDVGCSQGITSILLAREGFRVTAIDTHPDSVAFARAEIAREGAPVQARIELAETDLASVPAEPAFDTILLGEVIEHQALPLRLLRQAKARLRPGGVLVITTPFALHPHPDHKVSLFPRDLVEFADQLGMAVLRLEADGDYMRAVFGTEGRAADGVDLLRLTEQATLQAQTWLFGQMSQRSEQLKKKTEALKAAQKKLLDSSEAAAALEAQVGERGAELKTLRAQHTLAIEKLRDDHGRDVRSVRAAAELAEQQLRDARAALARAEDAGRQAESGMAAVRAEMQRQTEALRSQLTGELRDARAALEKRTREGAQAAQAAARHAASLAAQYQAEEAERANRLAAADRRLRDSESRLQAAQAEARAAQLAHVHERSRLKEQNDRLKERLAALKATMAATKATTSYRLGRMLVRGLKTPRTAIALPGQLWSLWREVMARRRARAALMDDLEGTLSVPAGPAPVRDVPASKPAAQAVPSPAAKARPARPVPAARHVAPAAAPVAPLPNESIDLDALRARLEREGLASVKAVLTSMKSRLDPKLLASRTLQLGKSVSETAGPAVDFELATLALALDRSEQTLRGYFWVAQRTRHFEQACATIRELESLYGRKPTAPQQAILDKLRISPAYQLSALALVVDGRAAAVDSVPGRVCYVLHNSLPYSSGGYGTRSHGVAGGLKAAGREVIVLTRPGFPLDIKTDLAETDVAAEDFIDGIRYVRTLEPRRKGVSMLQYVTAAADALEERLREWRPEIVISASNHVTALPALIAARRLGLPFIYEVRGLWEITRISREQEFEDTPAFAVQSLLEAKAAQLADHVFTLTEPMREELVERGVPRQRVDLLPNSCDPDRFLPRPRDGELAAKLGIPDDVPVVGYIGTFVDYEGLEDLTLACTMLKKRGVQFRLLLVGNENASGTDRGPITEQIVRIADAEGMSDWLIMPGRVPHEEVESYYSLIDVAPFPRKPWPVCEMVSPMKPLEALAMEKPVLVSSVRALTEMIADGHTGRVFEKGNIASLADRLAEMLADPLSRRSLGQRGRAWVCAERTWTQVGALLARRIDRIRAERPGRIADVEAAR